MAMELVLERETCRNMILVLMILVKSGIIVCRIRVGLKTLINFLGKKIIKASEISKIAIRDGEIEITYKDNGNTENYTYSFNPYKAMVPIFEFILNNNIEYEDEQGSDSKLYDEECCKQVIDDFIVECKNYGDKLIKEKIGSEYEFYIDRHDYKHRSFIQYWLLENGKKKEFPRDVEGENGEKIMDDLEMSFLVKNYV